MRWPLVLLCPHLPAAARWVAGMAAMHFAVRPAAVPALEPPQRLPFLAAAQLNAIRAGVRLNLALGTWVYVLATLAG